MVDINTAFPSKWLKAHDLFVNGQYIETKVTISHAVMEMVQDQGVQKPKLAVYFLGKEKALLCNKTNAYVIADNLGYEDTDMWVNGVVTLYAPLVDAFGKMEHAIRIKPKALESQQVTQPNPAPATQQAAPAIQAEAKVLPNARQTIDDEIPF
jgi:hypothetical protein